MPPHSVHIDQRKANAAQDVVAGDKIAGDKVAGDKLVVLPKKTKIEVLLERLKAEIEDNSQASQRIEDLQHFYNRHADDNIDGLEKKLRHSGRENLLSQALREKEAFNKKLEEFTHYSSAQEIFALLLSKVFAEFDTYVRPELDKQSVDDIIKLTKEKVIEPVMEELAQDIMRLNYTHVNGMVYWLAEQCFIRWHK